MSDPATRCFACASTNLRPFYRVESIPVHSCLLMDSPEEARAYPKGQLELAFCDDCGFIFNRLFDPAVHEYSPRYEETQAFSGTFNRFAEGLARDLIERHGLRGKRIVEVGCGKGEFLLLLCELGPNEGIGIDPGYRPDRTAHLPPGVRFIQDLYQPEHADLDADMICCRHTLEHIQPVFDFTELTCQAARRNPESLAFFELPAIERELVETAFWDIYYEHCSYFSAGSLARLFRRCGFDVTDLKTVYDRQYLLIEGQYAPQDASAARLPEEDDLDWLREWVAAFEKNVAGTLAQWRNRMAEWASQGKRVALWGSGSKGVAFLTTLGLGGEVAYVVDINPFRQGKFMPGSGHRIVGPQDLPGSPPDVVVLMNPIYEQEVGQSLAALGLSPLLLPVTAIGPGGV